MDMQDPPRPPDSEPLEQFLWEIRHDLFQWMVDFKNGAFKDKMEKSMTIWKCFNFLRESPLLTAAEKDIVTAQAHNVFGLVIEFTSGKHMTIEQLALSNYDASTAFAMMVDKDRVSRGQDRISRIRNFMLSAPNGTECRPVVASDKVIIIRKDNLDDLSRFPPETMFIVDNHEPKRPKTEAEKKNNTKTVTGNNFEKWNKEEGAAWFDYAREQGASSTDSTSSTKAEGTVNANLKRDGLGEAFKKNVRGAFM
ncbi:hypothetical protein H2200_011757 [Cladophialophora chaetospira]|uniref:Uncharacterized protein n=1 Tax=Cladophialophora chaetospira TaxID=386627 RepID=A0AA38WYN9_9EURO|nr:hypothetical protein H2200_011757 [Cladophialophora chaetospira]